MDRPDQIEAQTIYARRKWSAERLEIPLNASKKDARTQWLKSLEEADFLPDDIHLPSWRIVSDAASAAEARKRFPEWASNYDDAIGREIEAFAQRFFALDPAERRKEFTRLFNASRDNPRQQKRISSLSPGLKLPQAANPFADADDDDAELMLADVEELSQHLRSLFVATPPARARLHLEFLREHAEELPRWASAAKVLKDSQPELAELVNEQWEELTGWDVRQRQAASFQAGLEERVALQAIQTQREEASARSDSGSFFEGLFFNRYAMFAGVWILIKVVGALMSSSSSTPRTSHQLPNLPAPRIQLEDFMQRYSTQRKQRDEARRWVTMEEEEFQASQGEDRIKSLGLEKDRLEYWEWRSKLDAYEKMLDEKIGERDKLQSDLDHQKRLASIWKIRHQSKFEAAKDAAILTKAQEEEISELRDELNEIKFKELELDGKLVEVVERLDRIRVQLAGLKNEDPSIKPLDLDASP